MNTLAINGQEIVIKEYMGQRVVTFKEIDRVHGRQDGTARRNFGHNRKHFIEGVDFFMLQRGDNALSVFRTVDIPPMGITLLTQTGYLMLVKSFTDDLAWKVQRELVKNYFSPQRKVPAAPDAGVPIEQKIFAKNAIKEAKENISRRSIALDVLGELYADLDKPEYRAPLGESMKILSFDICSQVWDIRCVEKYREA